MRNKPGLALRVVVSAYYVLSGDYFTPTRVLAASMRISLRDYWRELEKGEEAVSTGLKMIGLRDHALEHASRLFLLRSLRRAAAADGADENVL